MLTLSAGAVRDYQACELFYELRHLHKEREPVDGRSMMQRRYDDVLRKVAAFFFYRRQQGLTPSYNQLIKRWEKLWFPKDMDAYDIAVEQHASMGNYASYASAAAMALLRFYEEFSQPIGDPIGIDQQYTVSIDRDVRLEGKFDLILRQRFEHRVVMWWTKSRMPPSDQLVMDVSAMKYAYEWDRGRDWHGVSVTYWIYNLATPTSALTKVDVGPDDVAALTYWVRRARDADVFVPRRGLTTYCRGCPFDSLCVGWRKWPH